MNCTELLQSKHQLENFRSGQVFLDEYLVKIALRNMENQTEACFVHTDRDTQTITGYYTLSHLSLPLDVVPKTLFRNLPKSLKALPLTFLSRLAIDKSNEEEGLKNMLLMDALNRNYRVSKTTGSFAIVVQPINNEERSLYRNFGFIELPDSSKMFLATKTLGYLIS